MSLRDISLSLRNSLFCGHALLLLAAFGLTFRYFVAFLRELMIGILRLKNIRPTISFREHLRCWPASRQL